MKISFAAKNLLCQKASFWHKPERCVPKEIIQQLLKLSFTSVLYTVSHPLEKSANGSNKASRFIWWCPHKGAVVLMQPCSMVKSKPVYFATGAILQFCYTYIEPLPGVTGDKMLSLIGIAYIMTSSMLQITLPPLTFDFPSMTSKIIQCSLALSATSQEGFQNLESPNDINHNWTEYVQITLQTAL